MHVQIRIMHFLNNFKFQDINLIKIRNTIQEVYIKRSLSSLPIGGGRFRSEVRKTFNSLIPNASGNSAQIVHFDSTFEIYSAVIKKPANTVEYIFPK